MTRKTKVGLAVTGGLLAAAGVLYVMARDDAPRITRYDHEAAERRRYVEGRARERELRRHRKAETRYQRRAAVEGM